MSEKQLGMIYSYDIEGTAFDGQTWITNGTVQIAAPGGFPGMLEDAMFAAFDQLTNGKAVFGKPGVGCRGPYSITKFLVEAKPS